MNLIGAPYQIIIGKKTEGEILEFQEVGKEPKKISLKEIIKILKEQKVKN
jgi:prolyl-tRNA synthetase